MSCKNAGQFPDMAIKLNKGEKLFTGGELIELKDSDSYMVSSFNSTIPSGKKEIAKVIKSENSIIRQQMETAGDDINSLPVREVFYLVRGRKRGKVKVALVHGSFFETINTEELISKSFSQVLEERIKQSGIAVDEDLKELLITTFSEQESFSKVRTVDKASVKLRFRVMTEVKAEGNILNSTKYPEIAEDTLNLVLPCHSQADEEIAIKKMKRAFNKTQLEQFKVFKLKHHFNGFFLVFQINL
ncbi:MAG: hypothetical protein AB1757_04920 [Acidobacteriota bacterium]